MPYGEFDETPLLGSIYELFNLFFDSNPWMVEATARHLEVEGIDLPVEIGGARAEMHTRLLTCLGQPLVLDNHAVRRQCLYLGRAFPDPSRAFF